MFEGIIKADGVNTSEKYLASLCEKTFLALWSYPRVYKDQGGGKEVCDLLVVFKNHVIIFSDKYCKFPETNNPQQDWDRWYKRAIVDSANQLYGAERWIKSFPKRLFLDHLCTKHFPLEIPSPEKADFHRILIAHGAAEQCRKRFRGGSGSLMLDYINTDDPLTERRSFTIGHVNRRKGFIHVFDDTTLDVVLETLDTISDLTAYLLAKERLIKNKFIVTATGEEELMAHYLMNINKDGEHDFVTPDDFNAVSFDEGFYAEFESNPQRIAQIRENQISCLWDDLIDRTAKNLLNGKLIKDEKTGFSNIEQMLRVMASENRTQRRGIMHSIQMLIKSTLQTTDYSVKVFGYEKSPTVYVLIVYNSVPFNASKEDFLFFLQNCLSAYCRVAKTKFPNALDIIGIGLDGTDADNTFRENFVYLNARDWSKQDEDEANKMSQKYRILVEPKISRSSAKDYPDI